MLRPEERPLLVPVNWKRSRHFNRFEEIDIVVLTMTFAIAIACFTWKWAAGKDTDRNNLILDIFANRAQTAQGQGRRWSWRDCSPVPRPSHPFVDPLERQKGVLVCAGPGESPDERPTVVWSLNKIDVQNKLKLIDRQNRNPEPSSTGTC